MNSLSNSALRTKLGIGLGALTMSIRRLPSELINRIAAGEVVERPASALEGARREQPSIRRGAEHRGKRFGFAAGGLDLIEVSDDGSGMAPADMELALERHATSKLPDDHIEDGHQLWASVARPCLRSPACARLTLDSRVPVPPTAGSVSKSTMVCKAGTRGQRRLPPGTRIRVEGLFDKVPGAAQVPA